MTVLAHILEAIDMTGIADNPILLRSVLACGLSFLLVLLAGPLVIRKLISLKLGQPIRSQEEVHKLAELHGPKVGTPTMGGILLVAATILSTLAFAEWNRFILVCLLVMTALAILGFIDDYSKVKQKSSDGISARMKLIWQTIIGLGGICLLYAIPDKHSIIPVPEFIQQTFIPFYGTIHIGWICLPFCTLTIVATSNAVNLTDGLDGLASGCTATSGLAFALIALLAGNLQFAHGLDMPYHPMLEELSIFLMALVGAALGFLWYNCYPARVFMGDTGSLAIGGALGMATVCLGQELLMIIIGGVFVMEGSSVLMQVISYKTTRKRIFRMAPIHHHFELGGWKETQVIVRFWMISLFCALAGLLAILSVKQ